MSPQNKPPADRLKQAQAATKFIAALTLAPPAWAGAVVLLRVTAALLGGYAFSAALVALLAAALALAGMARSEAVALAAMLGCVLYLLVLLWAFSVHSLARLWGTLAGGSVLGYGLLQLTR